MTARGGARHSTRLDLFGPLQVFVDPDGDVADDRVGDAHLALDFGNLRAVALHCQHDVVAFVVFLDCVSQAAASDAIDFCDLRPLALDHIAELRDQSLNVALFGVWSDYKQYFVNSHRELSSLWI